MVTTVSTTLEAYELARKLCQDYDRRKLKEKELNMKKEPKKKAETAEPVNGPSRQVTEIDYKKHEETVQELRRQEKEEAYQKKKQEASMWCTLDHEHGPNCRRPMGGCSHDHQKEWAIYEKSTVEKVKAADAFRGVGNEAYRKRNYGLAAVHYRKALLQFDYTFAEGEEEEKSVDAVKLPCLLNLAACKCQQEEWDEVLTHCRLALEVDPRSVKAFYRTGLSHLARDQFELAKDALMSAHEIEPKNAEVIGALARLKKNMENYKVRKKEMFKTMVAGSQDGGGEAEAEQRPAEEAEAEQRPTEEAQAESAAEVPAASATEQPLRSMHTPVPPMDDSDSSDEPVADAAHVEAHEQQGLRQRRPAANPDQAAARAADGDEEGDDEEDEDAPEALGKEDRRMLNLILFMAAGLAVTAVSVCMFAYWADK